MDPIKTSLVSALAATTSPAQGLELTVLEVPCLVEFWTDDSGQPRVDLSTLEGDHTVSLTAGTDLALVDVINNALIEFGDPTEWPGFFG